MATRHSWGSCLRGWEPWSCLDGGELGLGGEDLLLSLLAHPAQGEGEGSSWGWAWRSPCLSLSFGVCNMGVTMQYPAQVLWEADTPAGLIRGAPRAALPLPESQCSGGGGIAIRETWSHRGGQGCPVSTPAGLISEDQEPRGDGAVA